MNEEIRAAIDLLTANDYDVTPRQTIEEIDESFELWWNMYEKKRGKEKCRKKWNRMSRKDREDCIRATPSYVQSIEEKIYQKDPFTYLNNRAWEDEIIDRYASHNDRNEYYFAQKAARILNSD